MRVLWVLTRGAILLISFGAIAAAITRERFEPPVILAPENSSRGSRHSEPEGAIDQEIYVGGGAKLRGYFVPSDPGAPIVVHFLDSGASVFASRARYEHAFEQLADLGIASLAIDYSGVGESDGERSPSNLARDARAIFDRAVDLAGGDPGRVAVRGVSIGALAIAELLESGAKPAAVVLIVPVDPRTVAPRFSRTFHGRLAGALASWIFRPATDVALDDVLPRYRGELCVVATGGDELVGVRERRAIRDAVEAARGEWHERTGGHFVVGIEARRLFEEEIDTYARALCPRPDAMERCAALVGAMATDVGGAFARDPEALRRLTALAECARSDARLTAAVAIEIEDVELGARVRRWMGCASFLPARFDELRAFADLDDPAGALDFGEIELAARSNTLSMLGMSMWSSTGWSMIVRSARDGAHASGSSFGANVGGVEIDVEHEPAELWRRLEHRGLTGSDLRRHFVRTLLKAQRTPERVVVAADGRRLLEIADEGTWIAVDLDTGEPEPIATLVQPPERER